MTKSKEEIIQWLETEWNHFNHHIEEIYSGRRINMIDDEDYKDILKNLGEFLDE